MLLGVIVLILSFIIYGQANRRIGRGVEGGYVDLTLSIILALVGISCFILL